MGPCFSPWLPSSVDEARQAAPGISNVQALYLIHYAAANRSPILRFWRK